MTIGEASRNIGTDCFTLAAIELIYREGKKRENVTGLMLLDKAIEIRDKLIFRREIEVEEREFNII